MTVLARHLVHQHEMVTALGGLALEALLQRFERRRREPVSLPREPVVAHVTPPARALIRDYLQHIGGDADAYAGLVPPHLFPQWCLPLAARTLRGVPLPVLKIVNSGCRLELNAPLSADQTLDVSASLQSMQSDADRSVIRQRIVTSQPSAPRALVADLRAVVPGSRHRSGKSREPVCVPNGAERIACWRLARDAGLEFALLTGDINPIHWLPAYARAFGFESAILHGFATLARVLSGIEKGVCQGTIGAVRVLDVHFTRPLSLPADVGLYVEKETVFVGAPGEPAYLVGTFATSVPEESDATRAAGSLRGAMS